MPELSAADPGTPVPLKKELLVDVTKDPWSPENYARYEAWRKAYKVWEVHRKGPPPAKPDVGIEEVEVPLHRPDPGREAHREPPARAVSAYVAGIAPQELVEHKTLDDVRVHVQAAEVAEAVVALPAADPRAVTVRDLPVVVARPAPVDVGPHPPDVEEEESSGPTVVPAHRSTPARGVLAALALMAATLTVVALVWLMPKTGLAPADERVLGAQSSMTVRAVPPQPEPTVATSSSAAPVFASDPVAPTASAVTAPRAPKAAAPGGTQGSRPVSTGAPPVPVSPPSAVTSPPTPPAASAKSWF
ncbi:MAG: hypothetical protein WKG00_27805 [Polyangiaceae bacterium]